MEFLCHPQNSYFLYICHSGGVYLQQVITMVTLSYFILSLIVIQNLSPQFSVIAAPSGEVWVGIPASAKELNHGECKEDSNFDYSQRAQWLRASILGATDGLVSIASLMMGMGAVKEDAKAMILTGSAGLVAGASAMAIGEFVSVYAQLDIEIAQMRRDGRGNEDTADIERLPNPVQAALASSLAYTAGALVPVLAAVFISDYKVRLGVVVAAVSLALAVFGYVGGVLGKAPVVRSCARLVIGGWMAMAITFGITKLIGSSGLDM